jgi:hypothetical protein
MLAVRPARTASTCAAKAGADSGRFATVGATPWLHPAAARQAAGQAPSQITRNRCTHARGRRIIRMSFGAAQPGNKTTRRGAGKLSPIFAGTRILAGSHADPENFCRRIIP